MPLGEGRQHSLTKERKWQEMSGNANKNWTVLIVDDTMDNLIVAKTVLKFHGATVYTAMNGEEGLKILQEVTPTVILLDIRMPTMDGWTMFRLVRENPAINHIPIIAVTAYAMLSDREEILAAGFDGYISKPFDISQFIIDIEDVVNRTAQHRN